MYVRHRARGSTYIPLASTTCAPAGGAPVDDPTRRIRLPFDDDREHATDEACRSRRRSPWPLVITSDWARQAPRGRTTSRSEEARQRSRSGSCPGHRRWREIEAASSGTIEACQRRPGTLRWTQRRQHWAPSAPGSVYWSVPAGDGGIDLGRTLARTIFAWLPLPDGRADRQHLCAAGCTKTKEQEGKIDDHGLPPEIAAEFKKRVDAYATPWPRPVKRVACREGAEGGDATSRSTRTQRAFEKRVVLARGDAKPGDIALRPAMQAYVRTLLGDRVLRRLRSGAAERKAVHDEPHPVTPVVDERYPDESATRDDAAQAARKRTSCRTLPEQLEGTSSSTTT